MRGARYRNRNTDVRVYLKFEGPTRVIVIEILTGNTLYLSPKEWASEWSTISPIKLHQPF